MQALERGVSRTAVVWKNENTRILENLHFFLQVIIEHGYFLFSVNYGGLVVDAISEVFRLNYIFDMLR